MAEIQSALPAKFMLVASANKLGHKNVASVSHELASFIGVLKAQLAKPDAPDGVLALELKVASVKKPLLAQPEADSAVSPTPGGVPSGVPLASDSMLQAAAIAPAVISNGPSAQEAESDSSLTRQRGEEVEAKSAAAPRPEGLLKANTTASAAANAADTGQVLPLATPSQQTNASLVPIDVQTEAKIETVVSPALPSLAGAHTDAGATTPMAVAHPFEQVLRQAELKVNAAIEAPVRSAAFAAELGDKVVWLAGRQGQFADLSLNPPQMGALEVRLTVSGGDATAQFFSPNPMVRDAIDAALPKLRELMAQAGLSLGETEVRDQAFSHRENAETQGQAPARDGQIVSDQPALASLGVVRSGGLGLVDLYI